MSTQADNKRLMQRFTEEFWNRGNVAFADEIVAEDLIHDQLPPDWPQGRDGFKRLVETWRTWPVSVSLIMATATANASPARMSPGGSPIFAIRSFQ
jgi:SnoaL-like polyketide cyclase